jgi:hypothetical protein
MTKFTLQLFPSRAYVTVQAGDVIDAADQATQFHDVDYVSVLKNDLDPRYYKPLKSLFVVLR